MITTRRMVFGFKYNSKRTFYFCNCWVCGSLQTYMEAVACHTSWFPSPEMKKAGSVLFNAGLDVANAHWIVMQAPSKDGENWSFFLMKNKYTIARLAIDLIFSSELEWLVHLEKPMIWGWFRPLKTMVLGGGPVTLAVQTHPLIFFPEQPPLQNKSLPPPWGVCGGKT